MPNPGVDVCAAALVMLVVCVDAVEVAVVDDEAVLLTLTFVYFSNC
jgi:hypothetical protein